MNSRGSVPAVFRQAARSYLGTAPLAVKGTRLLASVPVPAPGLALRRFSSVGGSWIRREQTRRRLARTLPRTTRLRNLQNSPVLQHSALTTLFLTLCRRWMGGEHRVRPWSGITLVPPNVVMAT